MKTRITVGVIVACSTMGIAGGSAAAVELGAQALAPVSVVRMAEGVEPPTPTAREDEPEDATLPAVVSWAGVGVLGLGAGMITVLTIGRKHRNRRPHSAVAAL